MKKKYYINIAIFISLLLTSISSIGFSKRVAEEELEIEDRKAVAYVQRLHDTTAYIERAENGEFGIYEKHLDLVYRVFKNIITPALDLITALQARETYYIQYGLYYSYMATFLNEVSTKAISHIAENIEGSIKESTSVDFRQLEHLYDQYTQEILVRTAVFKLAISKNSKKLILFRNMEDLRQAISAKCREISGDSLIDLV